MSSLHYYLKHSSLSVYANGHFSAANLRCLWFDLIVQKSTSFLSFAIICLCHLPNTTSQHYTVHQYIIVIVSQGYVIVIIIIIIIIVVVVVCVDC